MLQMFLANVIQKKNVYPCATNLNSRFWLYSSFSLLFKDIDIYAAFSFEFLMLYMFFYLRNTHTHTHTPISSFGTLLITKRH